MKWKRKGKQVFAMMLAVATLLSGCAPNGIVFRWGYTCDYTQQGGAGNPFFMRFLSTVLGSSPAYGTKEIQSCGVLEAVSGVPFPYHLQKIVLPTCALQRDFP